MSKLATKVRVARQKMGLTQDVVAVKAGICRASVVRLEDGTHLPRFDKMVLICRTLKLPLEQIARAAIL